MTQPRITQNPNVMFGKPCVRGRRITVELILESLAAGEPVEAVASGYGISVDDVRAALAYAADYLRDEISISIAAE